MADRDVEDPLSSPAPETELSSFRLRSIGRHTLIYGIGILANRAIAIVMLPIYLQWLTADDYGVLQLITMTFEVVTILAGSRIAVGIFHFHHKAESEQGRQRSLSTAFVLLTTMYVLAAAGTVIVAPQIATFVFGESELYTTFIRMAAVTMMFEGLFLVPIALFQLEDRSKLFVTVNFIRLALQVVLNLIFLIPMGMGVLGVLWSQVITTGIIGTTLAVTLVSRVGLRVDLGSMRSYLRFGLPLMVMQTATFIVTFGDRYFLNLEAGTAEVGRYSLAYQFGFLVVTLGYLPVHQVWDPQRFAIAKRPDRDEIYAKVFIYVNVLLASSALGIALFAGDAIRLVADAEYHAAAVFVPVLAAAYVFQGWSLFLNLGIYITERTEYFTLANWVSALVAFAGYIWLIPMWQAWGAAVATVASIIVRCWLAHVFSQRLWRIEYRWGPVVRLLSFAGVLGLVSALSPQMFLPLSMLYHAVLFALFCGLVWVLVLGSAERALVRDRLSALRMGLSAAG